MATSGSSRTTSSPARRSCASFNALASGVFGTRSGRWHCSRHQRQTVRSSAPHPTTAAPGPTTSNEHRMSVGWVHSPMRPAGMPLGMALPGAPAAPPPHRARAPPPTPPPLALSHSPAPVPGPSAPRTPLRSVLRPSQPEPRPACAATGRMGSVPIRSPRRACLGSGRSVRIARPTSATARRCAAPDLSYRLSASSVRSPPCGGERRVNQTGLPIRTTASFGRLHSLAQGT